MSDPGIAANAMICIINQANYLLDRQIKSAEKEFSKYGDYNQKLNQKIKQQWLTQREEEDEWLKDYMEKFKRSNESDKTDRSDRSDGSDKTDMSDRTDRSDRMDKTDGSDRTYN